MNKEELEARGFEPMHTGGGCWAMVKVLNRLELVVTDDDGTGFPEDGGGFMLGVYDTGGDWGDWLPENECASWASEGVAMSPIMAGQPAAKVAETLREAVEAAEKFANEYRKD